MDSLTAKVVDRLERYTDHGHDDAREIARQVLIALNIEDRPDIHVYTEDEIEDERERASEQAYRDGHKEGYHDALHDIATSPMLAEDGSVEHYVNKYRREYAAYY